MFLFVTIKHFRHIQYTHTHFIEVGSYIIIDNRVVNTDFLLEILFPIYTFIWYRWLRWHTRIHHLYKSWNVLTQQFFTKSVEFIYFGFPQKQPNNYKNTMKVCICLLSVFLSLLSVIFSLLSVVDGSCRLLSVISMTRISLVQSSLTVLQLLLSDELDFRIVIFVVNRASKLSCLRLALWSVLILARLLQGSK